MDKKSNTGIIIFLTILSIIFFFTVLGLVGYIIIDKTTSYENKCDVKEIVSDLTEKDEKEEYDYSKLKGVYVFEGEKDENDESVNYYLTLDENGLYHYEVSYMAETGTIGNYTIVGDEIHLNQTFSHGSDAALVVDFKNKILKIKSDSEIVDNNPENSFGKKYDTVTLKKDDSKNINDIGKLIKDLEIFKDAKDK